MKSMELFKLKVDLLIKGVKGNLKLLREGGGGPIGGVSFEIDSTVVNAPYAQSFAKLSPYEIVKINGKHELLKSGRRITDVFVPKEPEYYKLSVDGIEMRKIVALDGMDTLVTSVLRYCSHKKKCTFCNLERGKDFVREKKPKQIAEVVEKAVEEDKNRHLVVTTGTPPTPDRGALLIAEVVKAVKEKVDIPIQVQIEPPKKLEFIDLLYAAGTDAISLNIETFDPTIRSKVIPEKPPVEEYLRCLKHSLSLFENVSSWVIVGLGEKLESLIEGCLKLCEMGVIPFVVPYRPPIHTNKNVFNYEHLTEIYIKVAEIMNSYGIKLDSVAGCTRCKACSATDVALKI